MFTTKNLTTQVKDVPYTWIFEHYCKLDERLSGQDIKIKSLFNPKEKTPSMCIYFDGKSSQYRFKDFSTGKYGDAMTLVKEVTGLPYTKAAEDVVNNYNSFIQNNNGEYIISTFNTAVKYRLSDTVLRSWTTSDQQFWTRFNIGSQLLEQYNVRPLEKYSLKKEIDDNVSVITITGNYLYGYFRNDGSLYKLYQPKTPDKKFLKIQDYVQGSEQLQNHPYLIITSSLKDIMSIKSLKLNIDVIAPDSENSMISKELMSYYISNYRKVIVMFDNDEAGIAAMQKYRSTYGIDVLLLPMAKDISDSIAKYGVKDVYRRFVFYFNQKLQADCITSL